MNRDRLPAVALNEDPPRRRVVADDPVLGRPLEPPLRPFGPWVRHWSKRPAFWALSTVFAWGLLVRSFRLGAASLWLDESLTWFIARRVADTGVPILASGAGSGYAVLHEYQVAGALLVLGDAAWVCRAPSVVFGILAVLAIGWLSWEIQGRRAAAFAMALGLLLTVEVTWARQCRMYSELQFLFIAGLAVYLRVRRRPTPANLSALALALIAVVLLHPFGYALWAVLGVHAGTALVLQKVRALLTKAKKTEGPTGASARLQASLIGLAAIATFGLIVLLLRRFTFDFAGPLAVLESLSATESDWSRFYLQYMQSALGAIVLSGIAGWVVLAARRRPGVALLLALSAAAPLFVLAFHTPVPARRYLFFFLPVFVVGSAIVLDFVLSAWVPRRRPHWQHDVWGIGSLGLGLVVFSLATPGLFAWAPTTHYDLGQDAPQPNFLRAHGYISQHGSSGDAIVSAWPTAAVYYSGRCDAWFGFDVQGVGLDVWVSDHGTELFTDAPILWNGTQFKRFQDDHPRGWGVFYAASWAKIAPDLREAVEGGADLVAEGSDDSIMLYRWPTAAPA